LFAWLLWSQLKSILENVAINVKKSHYFKETEQLIGEMLENIHKILQNRENNSGTVTEQKRINRYGAMVSGGVR
jgi:hypothetical protein